MQNQVSTEGAYVLSSFLDNPDEHFQGYCMIGSDYVFGDQGAKAYALSRGEAIGPNEDGCYVSVKRSGDTFSFAVDFSGNMKTFFAWTSEYWAVSNSLVAIIEHLKHNGVALSPNFAQLKAAGYGMKSSALNQLTSYSTIVNDVRLVPLATTLTIGKQGFTLDRASETAAGEYSEALGRFCSLWTSRFTTLLDAGVEIESDLTGGVDSRAVVALLEHARKHTRAKTPRISLRSGVIRGDTTDLEIATGLASTLGLPINPKKVRGGALLQGDASYASWRRFSLGSYHPIYFPNHGPYAFSVMLGGGGGENHRRFYNAADFEALVSYCARHVSPAWLSAQFAAEMRSAGRYERDVAQQDELIGHYRSFRNRLHTGRVSQQTVLFSPLASKYLEQASSLVSASFTHSGRVNFDVIASTTPSLLDEPFDKPHKAPNAEQRAGITRMDFDVKPGQMFTGEDGHVPGREGDGSRPLDLLNADYSKARRNRLVTDFWGAERLEEVQRSLTEAVEQGRFGHAIDGQPVAAVLASHLVLS